MAITPHTNLRLLKLPLYLNNKNQLTFSSKSAQETYFLGRPHLEVDNITYQRKDSTIRYPAHIDSIIEYNYCMYQNENYGNKWFYAYITNMEYTNDSMTTISITTDVWQTWQFDLTFKESFVEREMLSVADDVPGANLIPEGLEIGELKISGTAELDGLNPVFIIAYSRNPKDDGFTTQTPTAQGVIANGIPNGMYFWIVSIDNIQGALQTINTAGHGDAIISVFSVPAFSLIGFNNWSLSDILNGVSWWFVTDYKAPKRRQTLISTPSTIDGYTPKNQKLRTYPYLYIGFNPPNGTEKIFRYEDFSGGTPVFDLYCEINQNPSICFIPQNYRGASGNSLSDMVSMGGYPIIGWTTDVFNSWVAQNSEIINLQMRQEQFNYEIGAVKKGVETTGNLISGTMKSDIGVIGSTTNNALDLISMDKNHEFYISQQMAQIEKQSMLPNQSTMSGNNATLLGYGLLNDNIFTRYNIKSQFARKIDKYFDMYGYLTNERKIPNINNRPNWNYIKTIGCNIIANIPQQDLEVIRTMFDNGVTLWHNTNNFMDYSVSNR